MKPRTMRTKSDRKTVVLSVEDTISAVLKLVDFYLAKRPILVAVPRMQQSFPESAGSLTFQQ